MAKRALLSVSNKAGIVEFAKGLSNLGYELLSTGGTATALQAAGLTVLPVENITGFPECLDGRVKTLHPAIHAGLLAMRANPGHMAQLQKLGLSPIDIVVVNLYPFRETVAKPNVHFAEAIENIDIGGPTMLRAAAKNYQDVAVLCDPADYQPLLEELANGEISLQTKTNLCYKVFAHTAAYDAMISQYLFKTTQEGLFPQQYTLTYTKAASLRYGENPHQLASVYTDGNSFPGSLLSAKQLNGKELSYNNYNDTEGALALLAEFNETCVVAVKHATPCGVGCAETSAEAWQKAYEADKESVYGGVVAFNRPVSGEAAQSLAKVFLEIIIAPSFTEEALQILCQKKNLRLLELPGIAQPRQPGLEMRSLYGGLLVQERDTFLYNEQELRVVTKTQPTQSQMADLIMAWKLVKHARSNGIAIAKNGQSLGIGPGQVNRAWATGQALERSGDKVRGAALASDAYFPFNDSVQAAAQYGIGAIIQPGGSIRDAESIQAADEAGIAMVFTGYRHFKH